MQNKYWIIDTSDLLPVKDIFIGYTVSDNGELFLNKKPTNLDGTGCYTYIECLSDKIIIGQDFLGMQGIYHYKNEKRNIFSNGYAKLVDYLLDLNCPLSLHKYFCVQYMFSNEQPINMNDTMLNEIKRVGKDFLIEINLNNGNTSFIEKDYEISSIKVDSKECIDILDKWHNKWCNVYRNLVKLYSPLIVDLSGGMDSRICFGLLLNSNIDKNNVIIKRNIPRDTSYKKNYDDWDISQEILDKFGYNDRSNYTYYKTVKNDTNDLPIIKDLANIVFGNSKICNYGTPTFDKPIIHICGIYGDRIHLGDIIEIERYLDHKKKKYKKDMKEEDIKILKKMIDTNANIIKNKYKEANSELFLGDFSFDYIQRFLGGKMTKNSFNNDINISPFADPLYHKIKIYVDGTKNYFGMAALIYIRYFPDLIDFKFQSDAEPRIISEEEKLFAKNMCAKYPFNKIDYEEIKDNSDNKIFIRKINDEVKIREYLKKVLMEAKDKFIKIFNEDYFELAMKDLEKENILLQNYLTPIVSICYVLNKLN
jgi:hypothetical protein